MRRKLWLVFDCGVTLLSPDRPSFVEAPTTRTSSRGFSFGFIGALFRLFSMVNFELVYHVKQSFFSAVTQHTFDLLAGGLPFPIPNLSFYFPILCLSLFLILLSLHLTFYSIFPLLL